MQLPDIRVIMLILIIVNLIIFGYALGKDVQEIKKDKLKAKNNDNV